MMQIFIFAWNIPLSRLVIAFFVGEQHDYDMSLSVTYSSDIFTHDYDSPQSRLAPNQHKHGNSCWSKLVFSAGLSFVFSSPILQLFHPRVCDSHHSIYLSVTLMPSECERADRIKWERERDGEVGWETGGVHGCQGNTPLIWKLVISYCKGQAGEKERAREQGIKRVRERQEKGEGFWNILTSEGRRFTGIPPYLFAYLQPWWNNGKGEGKRRGRRERERGQMSATVCKSAGGELITLRQPFPETPARKS